MRSVAAKSLISYFVLKCKNAKATFSFFHLLRWIPKTSTSFFHIQINWKNIYCVSDLFQRFITIGKLFHAFSLFNNNNCDNHIKMFSPLFNNWQGNINIENNIEISVELIQCENKFWTFDLTIYTQKISIHKHSNFYCTRYFLDNNE